MDVSLVQL